MKFSQLDSDTQILVREFGEGLYPDLDDQSDFPVSLDDLTSLYFASINA